VYFNVNFNVFFKLINVHFLASELDIYQNARCNDKQKIMWSTHIQTEGPVSIILRLTEFYKSVFFLYIYLLCEHVVCL